MTGDPSTSVDLALDDGSIAHYAVLFTPLAQREAATAVFKFARTMRALVSVQRDVVPHKIHWWHEELARFADGAARHPLCVALHAARGQRLADALNALLHGAVMDVNEVEVAPAQSDQYLYMRAGAVHAALAAATGRAIVDSDIAAAGTLCGIADLLREARDPAFADVPAARLAATAAGGDADELERHLLERWAAARDALPAGAGATPTGAVVLGLYKAWWPRIIATPYGQMPPPLHPWRKLWTAWRAARAFDARGNTPT